MQIPPCRTRQNEWEQMKNEKWNGEQNCAKMAEWEQRRGTTEYSREQETRKSQNTPALRSSFVEFTTVYYNGNNKFKNATWHKLTLSVYNIYLFYLHDNVVNWNVDQLHKKSNESHNCKANCSRHGDFLELCSSHNT